MLVKISSLFISFYLIVSALVVSAQRKDTDGLGDDDGVSVVISGGDFDFKASGGLSANLGGASGTGSNRFDSGFTGGVAGSPGLDLGLSGGEDIGAGVQSSSGSALYGGGTGGALNLGTSGTYAGGQFSSTGDSLIP